MLESTRLLFTRYLEDQAELNGADAAAAVAGKYFSISHQFSATEPSVQQRLIDKQGEDSSFLGAINMVTVPEIKGEKLGLDVTSPIASRTKTNPNGSVGRKTTDVSTLDDDGYECRKTNSDTHITFAKLDMWAKFPDFQVRISNHIRKAQGLDRIRIGFNGRTAADDTDKVANPLLEDVNIGWLQKYRTNRPEAVLSAGLTPGKVVIKASGGGDYRNMHSLVMDAVHNLMPSWARNDPGLVAVLGDDLQHDIFFPLVDGENKPTEMIAADLLLGAKRIGGKRPATVPFMLPKSLFITKLSNLSIYEQEGKRRRKVKEDDEFDCVRTYESTNEDYVVEDYDFGCLVENIEFQD